MSTAIVTQTTQMMVVTTLGAVSGSDLEAELPPDGEQEPRTAHALANNQDHTLHQLRAVALLADCCCKPCAMLVLVLPTLAR